MERKLFALLTFLALVQASAVHGQTSQTSNTQTLLELIKTLQSQQAQLIDNQVKIDTKISDLAETIRLARIQTARTGGKHIPPSKKN